MFSTKTVSSVLFLLIFSIFSISKISGKDDESFESRLTTLEGIVWKQEQIISDQGRLISNLMTQVNGENNREIPLKAYVEDPSLEDRVNYLEEVAKIKVLRSCAEMEQHGVKTSGFYHLDPDGDNTGHPPIRAYCDFENQVTEILHDADDEIISIPHCDSNLCYKRDLIYSAQMEQITSLMQLSTFCDQTIEFNCFMAPLNYGDVQLGVWVDRNGEDQIYFDGANYGNHSCSCFEFSNCTGQQNLHNSCNCDNVAVPEWMQDAGKLTNMTALPVIGFKYGPLTYETQQASMKVGRLRCGGMKDLTSVPKTCQELKMFGETRPGLYHLQDAPNGDYPKMSFCQLDQPGYGEGMEIESYWSKLSTGPGQIYFSVKNTGKNDIGNGAVITFDPTDINHGAGIDSSTGIFTAPVLGVYDFKLSGLTYVGSSELAIDVYLNEEIQFTVYESNSQGYNNFGKAWMSALEQGDEVKLIKVIGGIRGEQYPLEWNGILM